MYSLYNLCFFYFLFALIKKKIGIFIKTTHLHGKNIIFDDCDFCNCILAYRLLVRDISVTLKSALRKGFHTLRLLNREKNIYTNTQHKTVPKRWFSIDYVHSNFIYTFASRIFSGNKNNYTG